MTFRRKLMHLYIWTSATTTRNTPLKNVNTVVYLVYIIQQIQQIKSEITLRIQLSLLYEVINRARSGQKHNTQSPIAPYISSRASWNTSMDCNSINSRNIATCGAAMVGTAIHEDRRNSRRGD
jgi:hypothetical protein